MNIVEHVARELCAARGVDPDGPKFDVYIEGDPVAGIPWAGYRGEARAAIIATLQYAKDNVSKEMLAAGYGHRYRLETALGQEQAMLSAQALLDALLQEIGGGE